MEYAESSPITADIEPGPDLPHRVVSIGESVCSEIWIGTTMTTGSNDSPR